ncbi:MAG TPA: spore germination protein GerW family protein [Thermoleophilia bacterium]|nr:spore germination protein GerW family protein [Thermoleophilia bacterium]
MADTLEEAKERAAADPFGDGFSRLAERLGASASASSVFGEPVERDGVTVIPVARVRWGVGGGSGRGTGRGRGRGRGKAAANDANEQNEQNEGTGGGGGVQASPLGFIELRDGQARYRRVHDPLRLAIAGLLLPLTIAAGGIAMIITLAGLARAMRGMVTVPRWHRVE